MSTAKRLDRTTFQTSREMDFFSEDELRVQTGHDISEWPLVIVKELVDNALDACEDADIPPVIDVIADETSVTVKDNGPGLPETTLAGALNFSVRASNREAYVSPCRGAQGNALKTLFPMPRVIDPEAGKFIVVAHGKRHAITCGACPISQRAVVHDDVTDDAAKSTNLQSGDAIKLAFPVGTEMRIEWSARTDDKGAVLWPFDHLDVHAKLWWEFNFTDRFRELVEGYAIFNPHATIRLDWFGVSHEWPATNTAWKKWKPCDPTSAHWYEQRHLERLIAAYITHDKDHGRERLVSEFIAELFDGLARSGKRTKVLGQASLKRAKLSDLVVDGRLDSDRIAMLLAAMQQHTRPVNSQRLGIIGEEHFKKRFVDMGVQPESFRYWRKVAKPEKVQKEQSQGDKKASILPAVVEIVFGYRGKAAKDKRRIYSAANWSSAIKNPFRSFGATGEGLEAVLAERRAGAHEPIVVAVHLAHPRVEYTDRGKSALIMEGGEE
jgi:DNA topoisomerase VI subunit B